MQNRHVYLLLSLFLAAILLGCIQSSSVHLAFGLKSCESISKVESLVKRKGGKWVVVEKSVLEEANGRPRYEYIRVETNIFADTDTESDTDFDGKTLLTFYNGVLMTVTFYPNDWQKYRDYLARDRAMILENGKWELRSAGVRAWIASDYEGQHYIAWEDERLANILRDWIRKYS